MLFLVDIFILVKLLFPSEKHKKSIILFSFVCFKSQNEQLGVTEKARCFFLLRLKLYNGVPFEILG